MSTMTPREKATEMLNTFASGQIPVPVVEIARKLDIGVFSNPKYQGDKNGHIELNQDGKTLIIVNENQSSGRKRFTIAHEIAHFVYDMDYLQEHRVIDRDGNAADPTYRKRERRANEFAAELLMPEEQFIKQWIELNNMERLAAYFGVSRPAATYRAINLGLTAAE